MESLICGASLRYALLGLPAVMRADRIAWFHRRRGTMAWPLGAHERRKRMPCSQLHAIAVRRRGDLE